MQEEKEGVKIQNNFFIFYAKIQTIWQKKKNKNQLVMSHATT